MRVLMDPQYPVAHFHQVLLNLLGRGSEGRRRLGKLPLGANQPDPHSGGGAPVLAEPPLHDHAVRAVVFAVTAAVPIGVRERP